MAAVPSREVTSTQVGGITFGFYSDDEVRPCVASMFSAEYSKKIQPRATL